MDFALALFPWAITMKLRMRKYEKVGLALTMSLGMLYVTHIRRRLLLVGNDADTWTNLVLPSCLPSEHGG